MKPIANLTIAISTFNRPEALSRCLATILSGEVLPGEIVVVDQSHDGRTKLVVEQQSPTSVPIIYVHHDSQGLGVSQNVAFAHASFPIVAVTDDDCVPFPEWISTIEQAFASAEQLDVLTGRVLPLPADRPGLYAVSSRTNPVRRLFSRGAMPWDIGSGNNFVVRRDWLRRIGGNDERLGPGSPGRGGVDMDLFYRLLRAGAYICYDPAVCVYHEQVSRAGRMKRRVPYGYGMGACCSIWLRQGDYHAMHILGRWIALRVRRLVGALQRFDWMLVYEEALVLGGTVGGLIYGLRTRERTQGSDVVASNR